MNNIKQEMKNIAIPKTLHERSKLGVRKALLEKSNRKLKTPLVAAAIISIISGGLFVTSPSLAMFEKLFEVTKFESELNNEEMSFTHHVKNVPIYDEKTFLSISEVEEAYNITVPFPQQLLELEKNAEVESVEYKTQTDNNGGFSGFKYNLLTSERNYSIYATNHDDAKVTFSAETADGTALQKEIEINGDKAVLLGTKEIDNYTLFIEKNNWKLIITSMDRESNLKGLKDVKEEEVIKLAESIQW